MLHKLTHRMGRRAKRLFARRRRPSQRRSLAFEALEPRQMMAPITLILDDSLDDPSVGGNGFIFNSPMRKDILEKVLHDIGARLDDHLAAIPEGMHEIKDPEVAKSKSIPYSFSVPENAIRVFVGGADFSGEGGAIARGGGKSDPARTYTSTAEYKPGTISLRFEPDYDWHYDGAPDKRDFGAFARHELLHGLGFGQDVWAAQLSDGQFIGVHAMQANGGHPVPIGEGDRGGGHFATGVNSIMREPVPDGPFQLTPLDWATLQDLGWGIVPEEKPDLRPVLVDVRADEVAITDTVQLDFRIRNDGPVDSGAFFVQFCVSDSKDFFYPFAGWWSVLWNYTAVGSIAANSTSDTITVNLAAPRPRSDNYGELNNARAVVPRRRRVLRSCLR